MDYLGIDTNRPSSPIQPRHADRIHEVELPSYGCLHELFEARVDTTPHAAALISDEQTLTYLELDRLSNQIARNLCFLGVGRGKFVGLYLERSVNPIISILGVLKAGAAYVPIDPVYPAERIRHIVEEAQLSVVLTESSLKQKAGELFKIEQLVVDEKSSGIDQFPVWRLSSNETRVSPFDLCYVIYTSGTTGRPKGVMTEHRNVYQFVLAFNEICQASSIDRIYQGFSLGFDGSVEEMWMAFSNGAPLVVPNKNTPKFGDELAAFLNKHEVTYFSTVPTLVATITEDIPSLRYLVVSGERCPLELVNRWAKPGRRILNVYGPTEATVNTTSVDCLKGAPVTIGKPLRGYEAYLLDEKMQPVAPGEKGELYVGGPGLARGYLKRPDLTAEKFMDVSVYGNSKRLYRTGDLVRWNSDGDLEFFGRIDSQVKIRGFRVELSEIEAVLLEHKSVRSAAVRLFERNGLQELAAYVTLHDPKSELDRLEILDLLESRMPYYMIPGFLDILEAFPMLTSGKTDRARLPPPIAPLIRLSEEVIEPESEMENTIAEAWKKVFSLPKISVEDDFFLDLGGHSLVAAQMVTLLRKEIKADVTVRDAYRYPTIRKLAFHLTAVAEIPKASAPERTRKTSREVFESLSALTRWTTTISQALSMYLLYAFVLIPATAIFLLAARVYQGTLNWLPAVVWALVISLITWPVMLLIGIGAKWVLIGRYQVEEFPLWSLKYFRFWLAGRLQAFSGAAGFVGTPVMPLYLRLMGAKIGKNCTINTGAISCWDVISIGENTSIGADSQLTGYRVEDGMVKIGRVDVGAKCFVGIHSALGLNTRMQDGAALDDQSLLPDGQTLKAGKGYRGSPALPADVALPQSDLEVKPRRILYGILHYLAATVVGYVGAVPGLGFLGGWLVAYLKGGIGWLVVSMVASIPSGVVIYCLFVAWLKKRILKSAEPGVYSIYSPFYLRKWLSDGLMTATRSLFLPLYTTIYFPPWLRIMGAKIGARAELSTVWAFSPELVEVAEESFFADGSIVGGKRLYDGKFEIGINRIGTRSFVGNSAILPMGHSLGDRCLLGVQSITPKTENRSVPDGSEWLGSPPFPLPYRPKVGNFSADVTFRPSKKLYFQRALIDGLRILIPGYIGLTVAVLSVTMGYHLLIRYGVWGLFLLAPFVGFALSMFTIACTVAIKKLVMGTFKPVIKPLWSPYVWWNEMVNGIYESIMAPALATFLGTPFVAFFLRRIGCKIGRRTYIESILFSEFDLVSIGDYASLNAGSIIQTHLFEDRVMKSSYLKVGDECSVGNMAVVLYDTEMQRASLLGPLSLLMKGENLAPLGRWHGIPTVQVK